MGMLQVSPVTYAKGIASFVPGLRRLACARTGGTISARYCYSVWMRHLVRSRRRDPSIAMDSIAELGPGDSLGIGLAALLSGARTYVAFDVRPYAVANRNLAILDDLIALFTRREAIPDEREFPGISPHLERWDFPSDILDNNVLSRSLDPARVDALRSCLRGESGDRGVSIRYIAPWDDESLVERETIDFAFSQAVMEHVDEIDRTYACLYRWLKPGAFMSHTIDYRCHGLTRDWFGHWTVPDLGWRIVRGNRPYLINRRLHSHHITAMERAGFKVVGDDRRTVAPVPRRVLARRFRDAPGADLETSGSYVQCVRL